MGQVEGDVEDKQGGGGGWLIGLGLLLTALLLSAFGVLLLNTEMPGDCAPGIWLIDRLACLEPNALGDTFAGAFAPVAFVWLVIAVLLQRNELSAQRRELVLARTVAKQQVEEAAKNVLFLKQQTDILHRQRIVDEERRADEHVEKLIELAHTSASEFRSEKVIDHPSGPIEVGNIKSSGDHAGDLAKYINQISEIAGHAKQMHQRGEQFEIVAAEKLNALAEALRQLHHTAEKASPPVVARVGQIRVHAGLLACSTLLKYSDFYDDEDLVAASFTNDP